ncbi:MAG: GspH/FimT family pseudopilin [Betaproteobacteria bacterium]|jgi:type IV fimbrial biogenesis protein FimT
MDARRRARGVTLIELLVGISILGLLMVMAAPGLAEWFANTRLRNTAEALATSLQNAKGEAVTRNARVRFQLTSSLGNDCAVNDTGPHWVLNLDPDADPAAVAGQCAAAPSDTVAPRLLSSHDGREGAATTVIEGSAETLVFNGLGRVVPVPAGDIVFNVRAAEAADCVANGGTRTCLRVIVTPVGQVRTCNPAATAPNPGAC